MRFQLLGPLSITDGHDVVVLPPAKPTALLAALLLRPGEVVTTERLRQAVWGEEQPATAKAALQSCVLRLRRLLAKYGVEGSVAAVAGGYRLQADSDTLDLCIFAAWWPRRPGPEGPNSACCAPHSACGEDRCWSTCPPSSCTATRCRD